MGKLWQNVLKPKMFYGQEILIYYDREWKNRLESAQHQGCKILGVKRTTNKVGVRLELDWKSVEGETMVAKMKWQGKLNLMEENRWPKIVLREMEACGESI